MQYQYETMAELISLAEELNVSVGEVVLRAEAEATEVSPALIIEETKRRLAVFKESIQEGLQDKGKTPSGMSGGQAALLQQSGGTLLGELPYRAMTYAIAVNEANAKMSRIVACPTAGSCGIVPGCLIALAEEKKLDDDDLVEGFLTAAGIGKIITERACVAGAVGGCQAEVGTAAAMAAGAIVSMLKGRPVQVINAMAISLKNVLGLVCDPVAGLVEVPCVKRNGIFAVQALSAAEMAMAGLMSQIPADEVIHAMDTIGRALPAALRETSDGGLAKTPTGEAIAEKVSHL